VTTEEELQLWREAWEKGIPVETPKRFADVGARLVLPPPFAFTLEAVSPAPPARRGADLCPECNNFTLVYQEGCKKCLSPDCGYSEC
jgi:hypothetical protein